MAQTEQEVRPQAKVSPLEQGREVLSAAGTAAGEKVKSAVSASREKLDHLKKKSLEDLYQDTKTFIRENPGTSLVGGFLAGFILGRLFRRG